MCLESGISVSGSISGSGNISDLGLCVCVCEVSGCLGNAKSLAAGLNNLRVIDSTLLCSYRPILTVADMNLLLEGLFEPSVEYKCCVAVYSQ